MKVDILLRCNNFYWKSIFPPTEAEIENFSKSSLLYEKFPYNPIFTKIFFLTWFSILWAISYSCVKIFLLLSYSIRKSKLFNLLILWLFFVREIKSINDDSNDVFPTRFHKTVPWVFQLLSVSNWNCIAVFNISVLFK